MGYGTAETGRLEKEAFPLPADLIAGPQGEVDGLQPSLRGIPRPDGQTAFAAVALGLSLTNVLGGAHLPGTGQEAQEPWATDAATTSLDVASGNTLTTADHAPAAARPHLTTTRIHKGQTFWGIEHDDDLPYGTLEELNPRLVPTAIPVGTAIKTIPTGAVHEIATQHHEAPDAAVFEVLIAAEGGHTWHNGPKAQLPGKGDGVLLHEAGSGYFSGIVESMHTDGSGRHFAKVHIIELKETVLVRTSDTQRLIEFGSLTPAPSLSTVRAQQASEPAAANTAATNTSAAASTANSSASASVNRDRSPSHDTRTPSAVPSVASTSPKDALAVPSVSPSPETSVTPSASVSPSPAASQTAGPSRESDPAATGTGTAVTPDLGEMLNHPAKLSSVNTVRPGAAAIHAVLDAYIDDPSAAPSPGATTDETALPAPSGGEPLPAAATSTATSTETAVGDNTAAADATSAVAPDLGWLGSNATGKNNPNIPGTPGYRATATQASPANKAPSPAPSGHETHAPTAQSVGQSIAQRAKHFALSSSAYHQAWEKEAKTQGIAGQAWVQNLAGVSCDELTSSAVEAFDPDFPMFNTGVQYHYMMNSPKWEPVHITHLSQLKDGYVLNWGGGDESGGAAGHTGIYLGDDKMVTASLGGHLPQIEAAYLYDSFAGRPLQVFRPVVHTQAAQSGTQTHAPKAHGSPSAIPSPATGNTAPGSLAAIPGAVAPGLGSFAIFSVHPNTSTGSGSDPNTGPQSQVSPIPGTTAVDPGLSWLGGGTPSPSKSKAPGAGTPHRNSPAPSSPRSPEIVVPKQVAPADMTPFAKPSITEHLFATVLHNANSPAASDASRLYNISVQGGIDPAYMLAFFMHESTFGTQGEAVTTHSIGNSRCYSGAACVDQSRGGYAYYSTWTQGAGAWVRNLNGNYYKEAGNLTLGKIIPVYAPPTDNNNDDAYINGVGHAVQYWQAGHTGIPSY